MTGPSAASDAEPTLRERARTLRAAIIRLAHESQSPHIGGALSCAEIFATLYFSTLRLEPWPERDMCILSKGHSCMALYCALYMRGIIDEDTLRGYFRNDGTLLGHPDRFLARGLEASTGSLGHGLSIGAGLAHGFLRSRHERRVYVVMGDGECEEGAVWEAALFAPRLGLRNLTVLVDRNDLQYLSRPSELCGMGRLVEMWRSFGWHAVEVDGHSTEQIEAALREVVDGPKVIVARTIKGRGVPSLEDRPESHTEILDQSTMENSLSNLERGD